MKGNTELLEYVFQNSEMGVNTLSQLIDQSHDDAFKKHLNAQLNEYDAIHNEAKNKIQIKGDKEKGVGKFNEIKTYLMINIQTLTDKSASHIAEMLIIGSNMGIIQAIKKLKDYKDADEDVKALMNRLLEFEENNVRRLKNYL